MRWLVVAVLLLLQLSVVSGWWELLLRLVFYPRQISVLDDVPGCGELGDLGGPQGRAVDNKDTVNSCLATCTWQPNPFFKKGYFWGTKYNQPYAADNTFWILFTSPKVPKDLSCLESCFINYRRVNGVETEIRKQARLNCSGNELNTLTNAQDNNIVNEFIASNYSFATFAELLNKFEGLPIHLSLDPRIDCLLYSLKQARSTFGNIGARLDLTESTGRQTDEQQADPIVALFTIDGGKCPECEYFTFTATNPVMLAIEYCTIAKMLDIVNVYVSKAGNSNLNPDIIEDLALFANQPRTCDAILPDIFDPPCTFQGSCSSDETEESLFLKMEQFKGPCCKTELTYCSESNTESDSLVTCPGSTVTLTCSQVLDQCSEEPYLGYSPVIKSKDGGVFQCKEKCLATKNCWFSTLYADTNPNTNKQVAHCFHFAKTMGEESYCKFNDTIIDTLTFPSDCSDYLQGNNNVNRRKLRRALKMKKHLHPKDSFSHKSNRVFGQSTSSVGFNTTGTNSPRFPWLCSLKESGFSGRHRCGATLLSGPTEGSPVVIVSAAHCNYICKDRDSGNVLEVCCCRNSDLPGSCNEESSYCGLRPELSLAEASDLQIVCGEHSLAVEPEELSPEKEVVLKIRKIVNNPNYSPGTAEDTGENLKGPYNGYDIAVYHLTWASEQTLKAYMKPGKLYPACLPKRSYKEKTGIFAGWLDQEPYFRVATASLEVYNNNYKFIKQTNVVPTNCSDPSWMGDSNTYYPFGTECYADPSSASCFLFGNSGSGVVRKTDNGGYAFTGPLSMSKSCDQVWLTDNQITYSSENPGVFTDAYCYLPWIAAEYQMLMPTWWTPKVECSRDRGKRSNINQEVCNSTDSENKDLGRCRDWKTLPEECRQASCVPVPVTGVEQDLLPAGEQWCCYSSEKDCLEKQPTGRRGGGVNYGMCDFQNQTQPDGKPWDKCLLLAQEGYAYNIYRCKDRDGNLMTCANNCRGVDPNSVIIGGSAVLAAAALGAQSFILPAMGVAGAGGVGAVGLAMAMQPCNNGQCLARDARRPRRRKCCRLIRISTNAPLSCPRRC